LRLGGRTFTNDTHADKRHGGASKCNAPTRR
jgi:hypothetical protein